MRMGFMRMAGVVVRCGGAGRTTVRIMRSFRTLRMIAMAMRVFGYVRMAGVIMRRMGEARMIGERLGGFRRQFEMQGGDAARLHRGKPRRAAPRRQHRHDVGKHARPQVRQRVEKRGDEHVARRAAHRIEVDMLRGAGHQWRSGQGSARLPAASKPIGRGSWTTSMPGRSRTDGNSASET